MSPDASLNGQTVSPEEIEAAQKQQYDEIDRYLDSQVAKAGQQRRRVWNRDTSSIATNEQPIRP